MRWLALHDLGLSEFRLFNSFLDQLIKDQPSVLGLPMIETVGILGQVIRQVLLTRGPAYLSL